MIKSIIEPTKNQNYIQQTIRLIEFAAAEEFKSIKEIEIGKNLLKYYYNNEIMGGYITEFVGIFNVTSNTLYDIRITLNE